MNEQVVATVEAALRRAGVLHGGAVLLVALSGGPDSVALLRILCALRATHGFAVCAAHVEHGLRGEASLADEQFCRTLCQTLAVPYTCDHAGLAGGMDAPGAEARAREARYRLLLARAQACGAAALLTAHHRDDQAETVLSHLIRGSGARGLGGMREVSQRAGITLLRPLLAVPKQALLDALAGLPSRCDQSNADPCCQRNRLRAQVMPLLAAENPRAAEHIAQSAALLALDDDCLTVQAETLLTAALLDDPPLFCAARAPLRNAPQAIAARALRACYRMARGRFSQAADRHGGGAYAGTDGDALGDTALPGAADTLAMLALLHAPAGASLNLPGGLCMLAGRRHLHWVRMADGAPLASPTLPPPLWLNGACRLVQYGEDRFALTAFNPACDPTPDGLRTVAIPAELLARCVLRRACMGDRIHPFGAGGSKPLLRYFNDRKVDPPFRPRVPLLCEGDRVLWAAGVGAAEGTRLQGQPAVLVALLTVLPWADSPPTGAPRPDPPSIKE